MVLTILAAGIIGVICCVRIYGDTGHPPGLRIENRTYIDLIVYAIGFEGS